MTRRSVEHATIVIERTYDAPPARVFAAWSQPEAKARWLVCEDDFRLAELEIDFRVGGSERVRTGPAGGPDHVFDGTYLDIVTDQRIAYAYSLQIGDVRVSVSLATVELRPDGRGTRMLFTEQVASLDGAGDIAEREEGTRVGFDRLAASLGAAV